MELPTRGQLMKQYNAKVAGILPGLSEDEVREALGTPNAVASPGDVSTPSAFFREIGSMFVFPDGEADVIWAYIDPYRRRVRHYVGFKSGRVCATWKETLTSERAAESR